MLPPKTRRLHGLILGGVIGLAYGLISQLLIYIILPGIHFYQPPLGPVGNILWMVAVGLLVGYASAYPESSVYGWALGAAVATLILSVVTFFTGQMEREMLWTKFFSIFFFILPIIGALAPLVAVHRWAVDEQGQYPRSPFYAWGRIRLPLLIVLIAAGIGYFSLYKPDQRVVLVRMNDLVQQGLAAADAAGLPAPLQPTDVDAFRENASPEYTLQWIADTQNQYAIPRPATPSYLQSTVVARFTGGYLLACMYPDTDAIPECRDFTAEQLQKK